MQLIKIDQSGTLKQKLRKETSRVDSRISRIKLKALSIAVTVSKESLGSKKSLISFFSLKPITGGKIHVRIFS